MLPALATAAAAAVTLYIRLILPRLRRRPWWSGLGANACHARRRLRPAARAVRQLAHHRRRLGQNSTAAAARVRLPVNSFFFTGSFRLAP
jgi:hypothetical protein